MELAPIALCAVGVLVVAISFRRMWKESRSVRDHPVSPAGHVPPGQLAVTSAPTPHAEFSTSSFSTMTRSPEPPTMSSAPGAPMADLADASVGAQAEIPTFRIVALGLAGSGKTVFLSSLFHELHHPIPSRPYFLTAGMKERDILSTLYTEVVAPPPEPWPRGTRVAEVDKFMLDGVYCHADGRRQTVMRIEYLDYDGDLLSHGGWTYRQHPDLEMKVGQAHALLGMLDGSKVRDLLLRKPGADNHFESELDTLVGILNQATCPVHLLIMKWDVVRDYGEHPRAGDNERLRDAADALMRYRHLAALLNARPGPPVRLIPVSAIGSHFAELDAAGKSQTYISE